MASKKPKGLGRGLDALLGSGVNITEEAAKGSPTTIQMEQLHAGRYQPRTRMDEGALNELADSIREQGVMQPILVRLSGSKDGKDTYEIIAGERRFRASQIAGLSEMPALVKDVDDQAAAAMALIEKYPARRLEPTRGSARHTPTDYGFRIYA